MATTLSQISIYNPQRMSDEAAENLYVVRQKVLQFLMDKINQEADNSIPQHHLIIGQRGMGKSTLLKRIEVELRKEAYKHHFIPLLFPEEQYNVASLADLWLNSLDALADALETQNEKEKTAVVDAKIKALQTLKQQDTIAQEAFHFLLDFTHQYHLRPVLLIDNINLIFDRLDASEQHKLRAWLMKNGAPIIVGASVTAIEDTFDYGAPFYDAFQFQYLNKMNFEELMAILLNLATLTNAPEVTTAIHSHRARLKTICQLTGGNPRTANLLYRLIVKGFSKEISDDLEGILDEITPLYKARFEELSPQLQIIVDAIALHWDPINIEQLRAKTAMQNAQLSPQLKRLVEAGWIDKVENNLSKGSAYEISERFFNIWFIMRRSSRRQKKELYCLSRFLESMYGEELHEYANGRLKSKSMNSKDISYNLAIAQALKDGKLSKRLKEKTIKELKVLAKDNPEILNHFDIDEMFEKNQYEKQEKKLLKIIAKNPNDASSWNNLGNLYQDHLNNYTKAEEAYIKAIELDKNFAYIWYNLGNLYQHYLGKYKAAEKAYKTAIKLDERDADNWKALGDLYKDHMSRYEEAEHAYKAAIKLANNDIDNWIVIGDLYADNMGRYKEAEEAYKKAIKLDEKDAYILTVLGNLYAYDMGNYEEAEEVYKAAIKLDNNYVYTWLSLGDLYAMYLGNYNKAEHAYKKAIESNKDNYFSVWPPLASLYADHMRKYDEAEEAYKKAIECEENNNFAWSDLGNLYRDHLKKYEEAEEAYIKAIELDSKNTSTWNRLGNLYQDYQKQYSKAEEAYQSALSINPHNTYAKYNLVFLYRDKMNRVNEAKELFDTIAFSEELADTYYLNKALFALYNKNEGTAKECIDKAFEKIIDQLPFNTQDDWWRFGAVVTKLGYAPWFLQIMEDNGFDTILGPYYLAIKALQSADRQGVLNTKATEIREAAITILETMERYID